MSFPSDKTLRRERIRVNGIVQGVGFRPFIYRLAKACHLNGHVRNNGEGVLIEIEGTPAALADFHVRLRREPPPLARLLDITIEETTLAGDPDFAIHASNKEAPPTTLIAPDTSICSDCLNELFDPNDRRYRYPFINCTNCGPRYTIVHGIPYDRANTSMQRFRMCRDCQREYDDPYDRRFHAQPNACAVCGPGVTLHDQAGQLIAVDDPFQQAATLLRQGKILAIRGLGGFHLAVDPCNDKAVQELRRRKGRAEKPFALIASDLPTIEKFCDISPLERDLLQQHTRPIVLLRARPNHDLVSSVAPGQRYLGFMLPYTPLHYLLLRDNFEALVMTSGNFSEEPLAIGNDEALERLAPLADFLLLHDRDILQRCDDSIARVVHEQPRLIRRSRGYVPSPVLLSQPIRNQILACGGELKNTIALARSNTVFLSQHVGDLDNPAAFAFFENSITHLQQLLEITPELIAYDLHPEYLSTKWALQQEHLPKVGVQHHHAHLAAVMGEHGVTEKTIGLILDGTGYGTDGTVWGGEILVGDAQACERFAWLQPVAMPGGAAAIRQPWRMALSYLYAAYGERLTELDLPMLRRLAADKVALILQMIDKQLNAPLTSSCGRLFDAVAALLNLQMEVTYEAQAAIALEMIVDESEHNCYREAIPASLAGGPISLTPLIQCLVKELQTRQEVAKIATRFHLTLIELLIRAAQSAQQAYGINRVGLSGGVYQNAFLFHDMVARLEQLGFEVLTHSQVPTNDGGLALGQIVIVDAKTASGDS